MFWIHKLVELRTKFRTTIVLNTKIAEVGNKILDVSKYITTPKFSKFSGEIFEVKIKQAKASLVGKNDFDGKLINFNKKIF